MYSKSRGLRLQVYATLFFLFLLLVGIKSLPHLSGPLPRFSLPPTLPSPLLRFGRMPYFADHYKCYTVKYVIFNEKSVLTKLINLLVAIKTYEIHWSNSTTEENSDAN